MYDDILIKQLSAKSIKKIEGKMISVNFKMSTDDFKNSILEIIVNGGCSYNFLNCRGFRNIINPISECLSYTVNPENIKEVSQCKMVTWQNIKHDNRALIIGAGMT